MFTRARSKHRWSPRARLLRLAGLVTMLSLAALVAALVMILMPGKSHRGPLPPLSDAQRALAAELERDVRMLASEIGERNVTKPRALEAAASRIEQSFAAAHLVPQRQTYAVHTVECSNISGEIAGATSKDEIVIVGAHYDSVYGCPGANDNATGVAAMLALARRFATAKPQRTLRFVAFVNEEPNHFQTGEMGSLVYARACKQRDESVIAMLSLETLGCYSDAEGSQKYPLPILDWIYPTTGNFITFVGNVGSRSLVRECVKTFRREATFPSEGAALPGWVPGVSWSDQWSFWQCGYPGVMVTDTAPFRYAQYHTAHDTPDKVDFERLARVVDGLRAVVETLAR